MIGRHWLAKVENRIGDVMVSVLASSAVDHGFEPRSGQTKDYKVVFVASLNKFWITFLSYAEFWGKYDGNRRNKLIRESIFIRFIWNNIYFYKKYFVGPRDKNPAPFKLNGQSRTAFGLLKVPELQRLSVTVEVLRVGVMTVRVLSVAVMTLSQNNNE